MESENLRDEKEEVMSVLILYYSYGGNTRKIAKMIQGIIGGDVAEIETVRPYEGSYDSVVNQGQQEVDSGYMPEIKELDVDLNNYDTIIIGTPVWWYTFAPAIKTFLNKHDFSGKNIYPYATNGGWIGHTFEDFAKECGEAEVYAGLNVRFDGHDKLTKDEEIERWVWGIK